LGRFSNRVSSGDKKSKKKNKRNTSDQDSQKLTSLGGRQGNREFGSSCRAVVPEEGGGGEKKCPAVSVAGLGTGYREGRGKAWEKSPANTVAPRALTWKGKKGRRKAGSGCLARNRDKAGEVKSAWGEKKKKKKWHCW